MNISKNGLDLIKEFEGLYLKSYKCPAGILTIGYGTTNADISITNLRITKDTIITKEKAEDLLKISIKKKYQPLVDKYMSRYRFNQNQYDALISFAYNIGSIDGLTNNGKRSIKEIAEVMLRFNHAQGKELAGLTRRRKAEQKLFLTEIKDTKKENTTKGQMYIVTSVGLNVRKGAGIEYNIVETLSKNNEIYIDKIKGKWGRIVNKNSWVNMNYVKKVDCYIVTAKGLNVRAGAGTLYKVVDVKKKNDKVYIDKIKGKWGRIVNKNSWVALTYLRKI